MQKRHQNILVATYFDFTGGDGPHLFFSFMGQLGIYQCFLS